MGVFFDFGFKKATDERFDFEFWRDAGRPGGWKTGKPGAKEACDYEELHDCAS